MSHYTDDPTKVRVDFFKPSGKWYATEAINWVDYSKDIMAVFALSLQRHLVNEDGPHKGLLRMSGMIAVCLDPYHEDAYPLMATNVAEFVKQHG